ncbi:uncharacterized protein F4812DRAFT_438498 [Daldinia caldariorum]|uniref:uncharacterized protein n=1 Tax=Daldinia caldariorum TaxID=326644 RepID=UPI0020075CC1|nr:uncharacterized protein F4812DRAFT_438498 [Daldinia caldariorum]KAI1465381.1 hypothetical protein F4812DRAFT_438498 [Daldinia caldariorum]
MNSSDTNVSLHDSPDNHGSVVNVVSWFLGICSFLLVCTRLVTKWGVSKSFHVDDTMIVVSLVFSIAQTIAASIAVGNGLGRHQNILSDDNIIFFQKSYYAANVLFVASQAFSKLSVIFFIRVISPIDFHRILTLILTVATLAWASSSVLMLIFQCDTPGTWRILGDNCINQNAMWNYINTVDIVLDFCLIWLPFVVVWKLQTHLKRKIAVISCFATRILTIAALIWQMIESQKVSNHQDATFAYWLIGVAMTLAQNLGIMTASAPYLKPFLDSLESGMIRSDDLRRRGNATGKSSYGYWRKQDGSGASKSTNSASHELGNLGMANAEVITSVTVGTAHNPPEWDASSRSSQTKLIKQVKSWGVTSSPTPPAE